MEREIGIYMMKGANSLSAETKVFTPNALFWSSNQVHALCAPNAGARAEGHRVCSRWPKKLLEIARYRSLEVRSSMRGALKKANKKQKAKKDFFF